MGLGQGHGHVGAGALAGRIEHDHLWLADLPRHEVGRHRSLPDPERRVGRPVVAGVRAGGLIALDRQHRPRRPDRRGQGHREQPRAGIEIDHLLCGARRGRVEDRTQERLRGAHVHLPEDAGGDPEEVIPDGDVHGAGLTPDAAPEHQADVGPQRRDTRRGASVRGDDDERLVAAARRGRSHHLELGRPGPRRGRRAGGVDGAGGHRTVLNPLELVGAVAPEADLAAPLHRHPDPAAPAQAVGVARHRFDHDGALQPGHPGQLFLDPRRLQPALGPQLDVLVVAATAPARTGVRAGRCHPVGRRLQHRNGIGPQVGAARLGHSGPDPFTGQCVPDEDDPAVGGPGHASAAGGHRTDQEFELVAGRHLCHLGLARVRHGGRS